MPERIPDFNLETDEELELAFFAVGYAMRLVVRKNAGLPVIFMRVNQELHKRGYTTCQFPLSLSKKEKVHAP